MPPLQHVLVILDRSRAELDRALTASADAGPRAAAVAAALGELLPASSYACLLRAGGPEGWAVAGASPAPGPGQDWLRREVARRAEGSAGPSVSTEPAPADFGLSGQVLDSALLTFRGQHFGALACARSAGAEDTHPAFLAFCAGHLSASLYADAARPAAAEDPARLAWLSNISELTAIISHEFNNFLNGILLHVAVLKQEVPKEVHAELDVIRGLGNGAAALVKQLQRYNSKRRGNLQPLELNEVVRRAAEERTGVVPELDLQPDLPRIQGKVPELSRLLHFLLDQAAAAMAGQPGRVTVRTSAKENKVLLRVEDAGPAIDAAQLPKAFEPFHVVRPGGDEAGLAIAHTLARHLHGSMRAENRPEGGVAVVVEFSPAR